MSAREVDPSSSDDATGKPVVEPVVEKVPQARNTAARPGLMRRGIELVSNNPWKCGWGFFLFVLALIGLRADLVTFGSASANEPTLALTLTLDSKGYRDQPWTRLEPDHGPLELRHNELDEQAAEYAASLRVRAEPNDREFHVLAFVEQEGPDGTKIRPFLLDPEGLTKMRTEYASEDAPNDWLFGVYQTPSITLLVLEFEARLDDGQAEALLAAVDREVDYDEEGAFDGHIVWSDETCHLVEPRARGGAVLPILQAPEGARQEVWCGRLHRLLNGLPQLPPPAGGWPAGAVTEVPALRAFVGRTIPTRREG